MTDPRTPRGKQLSDLFVADRAIGLPGYAIAAINSIEDEAASMERERLWALFDSMPGVTFAGDDKGREMVAKTVILRILADPAPIVCTDDPVPPPPDAEPMEDSP